VISHPGSHLRVKPHGDPNPYRLPKSRANRAGLLILVVEDVMYDSPAYVWAIIIAGATAGRAAPSADRESRS
jgi:hypothetical protein